MKKYNLFISLFALITLFFSIAISVFADDPNPPMVPGQHGTACDVPVGAGFAIKTWSGLFSTDWNTDGNWVGNVIPLATDDVIIPAGCPNYPIVTSAEVCRNAIIQSGASLTINEACIPPIAPTAGTHYTIQFQIEWNWNAVPGATGYKWNTTNNFATATDMGTITTKTETGLTCNTVYTRYVWAYNECGYSTATNLIQTAFSCCSSLSATIDGGGLVCKNTTTCPLVTFCGVNSIFPYTFTYKINNGQNQTLTTTGANTCVSLTAPTDTPGTFVYTLVSVNDADLCSQPASGSATVTVRELPTATIGGGGSVCQNMTPSPIVNICGANSIFYTFIYKINNGPNQNITTPGMNPCVSINAPTGIVGSFDYMLVSVSDAYTCSQQTSGSVTVTINDPPNAPTAGTHIPLATQIIWNWNTVSSATGYKWNTTNNFATATDMGTTTTKTETGLTSNTAYTRYVWAYSACGNSFAVSLTQQTLDCNRKISGHMKYPNCDTTPMNNVTLGLLMLPGTTPISTCVTDTNGYFQFLNLCQGYYTIIVLNNNKVVNGDGINSTDAAQVGYWSRTYLANPISHVRFLAGDVSNDDSITSLDSLLIHNYFINGPFMPPPAPPNTPYFTRAPWSYWVRGNYVNQNPPVPSSTTGWCYVLKSYADLVIDMEALATGDFNASWIPGNE